MIKAFSRLGKAERKRGERGKREREKRIDKNLQSHRLHSIEHSIPCACTPCWIRRRTWGFRGLILKEEERKLLASLRVRSIWLLGTYHPSKKQQQRPKRPIGNSMVLHWRRLSLHPGSRGPKGQRLRGQRWRGGRRIAFFGGNWFLGWWDVRFVKVVFWKEVMLVDDDGSEMACGLIYIYLIYDVCCRFFFLILLLLLLLFLFPPWTPRSLALSLHSSAVHPKPRPAYMPACILLHIHSLVTFFCCCCWWEHTLVLLYHHVKKKFPHLMGGPQFIFSTIFLFFGSKLFFTGQSKERALRSLGFTSLGSHYYYHHYRIHYPNSCGLCMHLEQTERENYIIYSTATQKREYLDTYRPPSSE